MLEVKHFFDTDTATFTFVVAHRQSGEAAIIDPVLNYDPSSGVVTTTGADEIIASIKAQKLRVRWLLETHIHADHLTASLYIKHQCGGKVAIGAHIKSVLEHWVPFFNTSVDTPPDASQFDVLLSEGDTLPFGDKTIRVLHTPGHTPACVSYVFDDMVFVGDALFQPDVGTGRADFPGGSAAQLYDSIKKILNLDAKTKIYSCHDYPPAGRELSPLSTVAEQNERNILIRQSVTRQDFIDTRNKRDVGKPVPKLIYPSVQVNLRAGSFGKGESNGQHYIKIPVQAPKI